jgi:hypothetical protein
MGRRAMTFRSRSLADHPAVARAAGSSPDAVRGEGVYVVRDRFRARAMGAATMPWICAPPENVGPEVEHREQDKLALVHQELLRRAGDVAADAVL